MNRLYMAVSFCGNKKNWLKETDCWWCGLRFSVYFAKCSFGSVKSDT